MIGRKFTTSSSKGWLILARWVLGDAGGDVRGDSALQETERERERERDAVVATWLSPVLQGKLSLNTDPLLQEERHV